MNEKAPPDMQHAAPDITIVVPVYNERDCLVPLFEELRTVPGTLGKSLEFIFVDDGSTDGSAALLDEIAARDVRVHVGHFRRNYGKSAALHYGFSRASGDVVITLDADLQDDPAEIPRMLAQLAEGYDVVSGWKKNRLDPLGKTLPSLFFNWFVRKVSGLTLHDFNCGFKAYRKESLVELNLYGELHRYIPVLLHWDGFRIGEIDVVHRARFAGQSKFGARRLVTGAFDLLTVLLTAKFRSRPLHFFGYGALALGTLGTLLLLWLFALSILGLDPLRPRPMLYTALLCIITAMLLIATGLLGEMIKSFSQQGPDYRLRIKVPEKTSEPAQQSDPRARP